MCLFFRQVKCEKYWPDQSGVYGDITVTTTETKTFADYVTREFTLRKVIVMLKYTTTKTVEIFLGSTRIFCS